jgi:hypothetical protein
MKRSIIDVIAWILVIIGGLNWGLVGLFDTDVISALFESAPEIVRIIFILVGLAAVWLIISEFTKSPKDRMIVAP